MGVWWHALTFVTHERAKMSHKPVRNVTQAGPKSRGGFSVGFGIGMLSTARWLEMLQRAKKGVETIHFVKCWPKIGVEIRHFPHFCSNIGAETIQIFQRPKKGGRNGGAYVVTFIMRVPSPGPKCHTSRAKMSHKGQNVTQSCYNKPQWVTVKPLLKAAP